MEGHTATSWSWPFRSRHVYAMVWVSLSLTLLNEGLLARGRPSVRGGRRKQVILSSSATPPLRGCARFGPNLPHAWSTSPSPSQGTSLTFSSTIRRPCQVRGNMLTHNLELGTHHRPTKTNVLFQYSVFQYCEILKNTVKLCLKCEIPWNTVKFVKFVKYCKEILVNIDKYFVQYVVFKKYLQYHDSTFWFVSVSKHSVRFLWYT